MHSSLPDVLIDPISERLEVVMHTSDMEQVLPNQKWNSEDLPAGQWYPNCYRDGYNPKPEDFPGAQPHRQTHGIPAQPNGRYAVQVLKAIA